ncbi:MAG: branched-chain amino acid ABC transporter permease [Eubacteriales bacterium]|nr:branched-chain amino acid ABC transporter permease [Eubacteriales bacterium]
MYITLQNLLTAAAILSAATALLAAYNKTYDWLRRQQKQDEAIADLKAEQGLLTRGVLACLKGLHEQGCNGPVTEAIREIESYVNQKAHE